METVRRFGLVVLLALAVGGPFGAARAGDGKVEIPIPSEVREGLESVGIKVETKSSWLEEPAVWIAGAIVVAGLAIAYAIRQRKS